MHDTRASVMCVHSRVFPDTDVHTPNIRAHPDTVNAQCGSARQHAPMVRSDSEGAIRNCDVYADSDSCQAPTCEGGLDVGTRHARGAQSFRTKGMSDIDHWFTVHSLRFAAHVLAVSAADASGERWQIRRVGEEARTAGCRGFLSSRSDEARNRTHSGSFTDIRLYRWPRAQPCPALLSRARPCPAMVPTRAMGSLGEPRSSHPGSVDRASGKSRYASTDRADPHELCRKPRRAARVNAKAKPRRRSRARRSRARRSRARRSRATPSQTKPSQASPGQARPGQDESTVRRDRGFRPRCTVMKPHVRRRRHACRDEAISAAGRLISPTCGGGGDVFAEKRRKPRLPVRETRLS